MDVLMNARDADKHLAGRHKLVLICGRFFYLPVGSDGQVRVDWGEVSEKCGLKRGEGFRP